jgi:hypothetical protein
MRRLLLGFLIFSSLATPQSTGSKDPSARGEHLLFDTTRKQLLLLGGTRETGRVQLWRRHGGVWAAVAADPAPAARELGGAAWDSRRGRLVLFGGVGLASREDRYGDTWEWDGAAWHRAPDGSVGTRDHHALAYDTARARTVLYGGTSGGETLATTTWEWDGTRWSEAARDGPGGRAHSPLVYDSARREVILFGGIGEGYRYVPDTWAWNGMAWRKRSDDGPPARSHHRMAFHRGAGVVVLFGGLERGNPRKARGDTWVWDGGAWTEVHGVGPAARSGQVMAYDESRNVVVLHGGGSYDGTVVTRYDDTWEFDGRVWANAR